MGKWADPSVTCTEVFTKAAHFGLNGQGAFREDAHQQTQGDGLCQSSCEEQLGLAPRWLSLEETVCSSHPSWEWSCPEVTSSELRQEPNTLWLQSCCWEEKDSALSPLTAQHKSVQAGILQQSCAFDPLLHMTYLFALKEGRRRKGDGGGGKGSRLQPAASDIFIVF